LEISEVESTVLEIIKEYLNKNRVFNATDIIPHIMNRLKEYNLEMTPNESGIELIIWKFIREHVIVPGSKLTIYNLLENDSRKSLFNHINKYPGTHLRELMEKLELTTSSTMWHINMLIRFAVIRAAKIGKYKAFFNVELPETLDNEIFHLGNKKINEIIQALFMNANGLTINQLAEQLGYHFNTVNKKLHILNEMVMLYQKEENGQVLYLLNRDRFKELMDGIEKLTTEHQ
jgi:predicted transcriptional regulator